MEEDHEQKDSATALQGQRNEKARQPAQNQSTYMKRLLVEGLKGMPEKLATATLAN
jgi:hypothetical protein